MQEAPPHPPCWPLPHPSLTASPLRLSETLFSQRGIPPMATSPGDTEALYDAGVMCPGI